MWALHCGEEELILLLPLSDLGCAIYHFLDPSFMCMLDIITPISVRTVLGDYSEEIIGGLFLTY